jgi:serine phosphatase RsbU (regulator of sigma subunit)
VSALDPAERPPLDVSILLVEDDHGDAILVQACLDEVGIPPSSISWARSLADALEELDERTYECVLLDLGLPDAMGIDAVRQVVAAAPDASVIVLTGRLESGGTEALAVGAQDYLVKDTLNGELLERSIRYASERRRVTSARLQLREANLRAAEQARLERGLLPTPLLRQGPIVASTHYQPGRDNAVLGGDFYDIVERPDGSVRAIIGDVMGHGPDEAALGVHLRVAWRSLVLAGTADDELFRTMAMLLAAESGYGTGVRFVTACDVTVERSGATRVRVAGHPAPLLCHGGTARYLDVAVGPPLGLELPDMAQPQRRWPATQLRTVPGDSLILYTDGLLDAHADGGRGIGIERLVGRITANLATGEPVRAWLPAIVSAAPNQSGDDIAIVVLAIEELAR